jgi:predicted secreted protein
MAAAAGRKAVLAKNLTPIAGVRVSSLKAGATPIDITSRDSAGLVSLLSGEFTGRQLTIEVSGITTDAVLRDIALAPAGSLTLTDISFKFADALTAADTITGTFFLSDYTENNPYEEASDFSATFVSSGAWTLG